MSELTLSELDRMIDDHHIIVCTGAGGVGKTTTSAAIALRAAERGRRAVVCTIDPARRLAQAMGLDELGNQPRVVKTEGKGQLSALMLDTKRTFDELVLQLTTPERAEAIFQNAFYSQIAGTLSGTNEYMAMAKLWDLHESGRYELIVVDTPPTRSALDLLDGPKRLTDFLEGRLLRLLLLPAVRVGRRGISLMNLGSRFALRAMTKITGATLLEDVAEFLSHFDGMYDEFRLRSVQVEALLRGRHTRFLVVAAPTHQALREASELAARLEQDEITLGAYVINRRQRVEPIGVQVRGAGLGEATRRFDDLCELSRRQEALVARMMAESPPGARWEVPDLLDPVVDLAGLRQVGEMLALPSR